MSTLKRNRPRPLMLSKRACVFYLERVRVVIKDDRIVYLTDSSQPVEHFYNIPEKNTAFLLLGKGSSITDAAVRRLAESNVMLGFCGSGGSPLFGALDLTFLSPQSEYRPTEYMQAWMTAWFDEAKRLEMGRNLLRERIKITRLKWSKNLSLLERGIQILDSDAERFERDITHAENFTQLIAAEGRWASKLYAKLASGFGMQFKRQEALSEETLSGTTNAYLDHVNYIAYGYAAVTLCGLGISFALPILHGKTRRGALVFDLADLVKDAYVMPMAFDCAHKNLSQKQFRMSLIDLCQNESILDYLFGFVVEQCQNL